MTPEQFCYWLQGRAELMPDTPPSEAEWKMTAEHLATVFVKKTGSLQDYMQAAKPKNPELLGPGPVVYQPAPPSGPWDANRIYCDTSRFDNYPPICQHPNLAQ